MTAIPPMTVTFDDGTEIPVVPKSRDMVGAEAAGHNFAEAGPIRSMYAVAFSALLRMERDGTLPDGFVPPPSLEAFLDGADVEAEADEDPEGEG